MKKATVAVMVAGLAGFAACAEQEVADDLGQTLPISDGDVTKAEVGKADSSVEAIFLDFAFEGELLTTTSFNPNGQIEEQMLYTIGHLNGDNSVGRIDKLALTNVKTERVGDMIRVTYSASLQVAWGRRNAVPATYMLQLPRDVSFKGLEKFTASYSRDCVGFDAHDVTTGNMWYHYRPKAFSCRLNDADVVKMQATVSVSAVNTSGRFPEYHKVWEDGVLKVVAIFGKYDDGATTSADAGVAAYNSFVGAMRDELRTRSPKTTPAVVPANPGVAVPDVTFEATLDDTHRIVVTALLVDNVRTAGRTFDNRYSALSSDADLIVYNGHAGLGANIRALASQGDWVPGQYVIIFMNGCDTYAYVDSSLFDAHAAINDDDPRGTKHVDLVTNGMPSFFRSMSTATLAFIRGLVSFKAPQTYEQIFRNVDRSEVVLVSGEEDNVFVPGFGEGGETPEPIVAWEGLELGGTVVRDQEMRFETPTLPSGSYTFLMEGTRDADLYIRVGDAPTTSKYDCRPFKAGSGEVCKVQLSSPAVIHGMVRGWDASSDFDLVGSVD